MCIQKIKTAKFLAIFLHLISPLNTLTHIEILHFRMTTKLLNYFRSCFIFYFKYTKVETLTFRSVLNCLYKAKRLPRRSRTTFIINNVSKSISEQREFLHCLINLCTHGGNYLFILGSTEHCLNHLGNERHHILFYATGGDRRCTKTNS